MLHLHRAERADALVAALGTVVVEPLDDPMAAEVVAVPTRGVERWLTQRLATPPRCHPRPGRRGVRQHRLPLPRRSRRRGGGGRHRRRPRRRSLGRRPFGLAAPRRDRRRPRRALARPAGQLSGRGRRAPEPSASDLGRRSRRFGSARHLADLYDRYGVHRPGMLAAWAAKDDVDGAGRPLPGQWAWQAELWRRLRDRIGVPSPAERLDEACAALRADATVVDLPARLSLFGLTRLPASFLAVLRALAVHRDVHLFLLHPSPVLWPDRGVAAERRPPRRRGRPRGPVRRPDGGAAGQPAADVLGARRPGDAARAHGGRAGRWPTPGRPPPSDRDRAGRVRRRSGSREPTTLLHRIQADVRADRPPPGLPLAGARRPGRPRPGRRQPGGARLPRAGPPGGGRARRHPPPPRRRPDARTPRHRRACAPTSRPSLH